MAYTSIIEYLKAELLFFRQNGYERESCFKPPLLFFRDSPSCLNFEPSPDLPARPCAECKLYSFVPRDQRRDFLPCHHIPLNERGETINQLREAGLLTRLNQEFEQWLLRTIHQLEDSGDE